MSNQYSCTIEDLFELFSDVLDPADILASKLMAQISSSITRERMKLHMNQSEFAKYINASQSLVSRWEHGNYNFSIKKLSEIATRLDLDVNIVITSNSLGAFYSPVCFSQSRTVYYHKDTYSTNSKTYTMNKYSQEEQRYASVC